MTLARRSSIARRTTAGGTRSAERIVGVYADPIQTYPNGDQVHYVVTAFSCRILGGTLAADDESLELRFFPPDGLPELIPTHRHRILQALKQEPNAYFQR